VLRAGILKTDFEEIKMHKSLVAAKLIEPSKELKRFFGDPPLIGNERLEDYLAFWSLIEKAAKPADDIARLLVWELACIWWEIRRERQIKAKIIKQKQQDAVAKSQGYTRADYERERRAAERTSMPRVEDDEPSMFRKKGSEPVEKKQEDPISLLAQAYLHDDGNAIEGCDWRLSRLEFRRSALLREVERRNQIVARGADKAASSIVDAEFREVED
jgi:hypothetical protein